MTHSRHPPIHKEMKRFKFIFSILFLASLLACDDPLDFDVLEATDFPPGIFSAFPSGQTVKGDFDAKVVFVDGSVSPLTNGTITIMDDAGTELATASKSLSGTLDSIEIDGTEFNAADMLAGESFTLEVSVSDSKGQETVRSFPFEITALPFAANHTEMYIAGPFNGWGADVMTIVADNVWEIKEVDLGGDPFKIKNCADWCDEDWGDSDCDGILTSNKADGGNGDSDCGISGLVNIRFNDQTLQYSITPSVIFEQNTTGLFLLGDFNGFQGEDYAFTQTADNTWELGEILIEPGQAFKFAEKSNFMGQNWGASGEPGKAELFGQNIIFGDENQTAFYSVIFNDKTLAYSFTFIRFPSIGIIGSATPGGWDADTDLTDNGDGTFSINIELIDGEAKFRANDAWDTNWGATDFPSGTGEINGPNIPVVAGTYDVTFTPETGEYNFELDAGIETIGIIGDASPGGWDSETKMILNDDGIYHLVADLTEGALKFRANDDWNYLSWGAGDFPSGTGTTDNAPNIPITAGIYYITFDPATGAYNFVPASVGIIGSATPGGWDSDTDLTATGTTGELSLTLDLVDGEAKFRVNNDWPYNWGGTGFPSGDLVYNASGNIQVTAGNYTVTINVNTGAYSFSLN